MIVVERRSIATSVLVGAWFAYTIAFVCRLVWSVVMTAARGDLGLPATQSGALASAFFVGYIGSQMPSGFLADRVGYRRVILGALVVMAPFITLMTFVQSFSTGVLLMALTGVGAGAVFTAGVKAVTTWYAEERRVTGLSMFQLGAPAGVLLANVTLPLIISHLGWRTAFLFTGAACVLGFAVSWVLLKPAPVEVQRVERAERASPGTVVRELMSNPNILLLLVAGFGSNWAQTGFNTWAIAYFIKVKHLSLVHAGLLYAVIGLGPLIWIPIQGRIGDRLGHARKWLLAGTLVLMGTSAALFSGVGGALMFVLFMAVGTFGNGALPVLTSFVPSNVREAQLGFSTGIIYAVWQSAALIAPVLMGVVLERTHDDYTSAFYVAAIAPLVSAFAIVWLRPGRHNRGVAPAARA